LPRACSGDHRARQPHQGGRFRVRYRPRSPLSTFSTCSRCPKGPPPHATLSREWKPADGQKGRGSDLAIAKVAHFFPFHTNCNWALRRPQSPDARVRPAVCTGSSPRRARMRSATSYARGGPGNRSSRHARRALQRRPAPRAGRPRPRRCAIGGCPGPGLAAGTWAEVAGDRRGRVVGVRGTPRKKLTSPPCRPRRRKKAVSIGDGPALPPTPTTTLRLPPPTATTAERSSPSTEGTVRYLCATHVRSFAPRRPVPSARTSADRSRRARTRRTRFGPWRRFRARRLASGTLYRGGALPPIKTASGPPRRACGGRRKKTYTPFRPDLPRERARFRAPAADRQSGQSGAEGERGPAGRSHSAGARSWTIGGSRGRDSAAVTPAETAGAPRRARGTASRGPLAGSSLPGLQCTPAR
jgi:hypothetical protein